MHLMSEHGCYDHKQRHIECGENKNRNARIVNTRLPEEFKPIAYKSDKHEEWEKYIKKNVEAYEQRNGVH